MMMTISTLAAAAQPPTRSATGRAPAAARKAVVALVLMGMAAAAVAQGLRPSGSLAAPGGGLGMPRASTPAAGPSAVASTSSRQADFIVAVVNSEPITNSEVHLRTERAAQQLAQQGTAVPSRPVLAQQVLERLITEKAQLQVARENGIKVDDAALDLAEQNVARQNQIEPSELRRRLAAEGVPLDRFREDLRNQLLLLRLREREVESRVKLSDLEIDQFIREQQQQDRAEPSALEINLAHVLVLVPERVTPERLAALQAKAELVAERARKGDDFGALAREFSDASERSNAGLLGLRPADRYPSLFVEATKDLPVGGIVGPLRSAAGFHVLKVVEKVQGGVASGDTVQQSHVRHILLRPGAQLSETGAIRQLSDYRRRLQSGLAEFAQLAREHSVDGSAKDGGDLGWANPGQFVPEFEQVVDALAPGEVSEPLVSRFGVHLIQLLERRSHKLTQREQRDMARGAAREKKLDAAYATWAQETRGRAYVEYREPPQ